MEQQVDYSVATINSPVSLRESTSGTLALAQMSENEFATKLAVLKKGRERIAIIQKELMEPEVDYGIIPGTPKPTLLKPGAEKLCDFYHYAAMFESSQNTCSDGTAPTISYITQCFLHLGDTNGPIIAVGQGSANSWERKHRYRSAKRACPECGSMDSLIKGRDEYEKDVRFKGGFLCFAKKGGCGAKFTATDERIINQQLGEVENPDPWDLDNTLLKMSEKRAFVDGTLRATATSGLFTQDVEDMVDAPSAPIVRDVTPPAQESEPESPPVQAPSQRLEARYSDLVRDAVEFGVDYIPLRELTDLKSIEAAGKALASKIKAAKENESKPAAEQLFP
jgi:hypothetical protein